MISIIRATEKDHHSIVEIGKVSVADSHKDSSPPAVMNEYLETTYNSTAIKKELNNVSNVYHIINYNGKPVGFSKIVMDAKHPNILTENATKLDRIYLLKEFHGLKLGLELLNFNIELSRKNKQSGMWLYTWIGNERATNFYLKAGFMIIGSHKFYVTDKHYDVSHHMFLEFVDSN